MTQTPSVTGEILLDAGTNELEVLVFGMGGGHFGVNVAKVREVMRPVRTIPCPGQHASVIGMVNIRGAVLPVIDLGKHLGLTGSGASAEVELKSVATASADGDGVGREGRVIITEFNGHRCGFLVESVEQIYRMSWQKVRPAPDLSGLAATQGDGASVASSTTGIIEIKDRLVLMVDFESVADAILMEERLRVEEVPNPLGVDRKAHRVVMAEDSPFMRAIITKIFRLSGYAKIEMYADGQAAWEAIERGGERVSAVVSDIEMPRMDGLHLTKRIKGHGATKDVPVILFSSLVSDDNKKKGEQVGADVQIPKPELHEMVRLVDRVIKGERVGVAQTGKAA